MSCGDGSPSAADRAAVRTLLGREPFTRFAVAVRCPFGGPAVLQSDPVDLDGRPFPTRYWLACRSLVRSVSRLEAAGGVRALEDDAEMAVPLAAAHESHRERHDGHRVGGVGDPQRVKCLHTQLAFALATGGSPVGDWILQRSGAAFPPERCCVDDTEGSAA